MINLSELNLMLSNSIPLAVSRFGDGEYNILNNIPCKRQGFEFDPNNEKDRKFRFELLEALQGVKDENYFVGISEKKGLTRWLEKHTVSQTVSANIFINQNYLEFLEKTIQIIKNYPLFIVGNINGDYDKLPFEAFIVFPIENNAWRKDYKYEEYILGEIEEYKKPVVVLVAGGAYSCVLIHRLWKNNPNNIYLDIGSTLDPFIFGQKTRQYHDRLKGNIT